MTPTPLRQEGPTPHGGVYSLTTYLDALGRPTAPERATARLVVEVDAAGQELARTTTPLPRRPRRNFRCEG